MPSSKIIPLEKAVTRRIKAWLDTQECFYWKTDGAGLPDIVGCYRGRFFGIEIKRQKNGPYGVTKLQQYKMDKIEEVDGWVKVATSVEDVIELFANIDNSMWGCVDCDPAT